MTSTLAFTEQLEKNTFFQKMDVVDNQLSPLLSVRERLIVKFIAARTFRWKKDWEMITVRHFVEGVVSRAGEMVISGTGLSERTVYRALASLLEKGYITRRERKNPYGVSLYEYAINWKAVAMALLPRSKKASQPKAQGLARSRKRPATYVPKASRRVAEDPCQDGSTPLSDCQGGGVKVAAKYLKKTTEENDGRELRASHADIERGDVSGKGSAECPETSSEIEPGCNRPETSSVKRGAMDAITDAVRVAKERTTKALQRRADKSKRLTGARLEDHWRLILGEHWEDLRIVPWNPKERGCAGHFIKYFGQDALKIMRWCVANWHVVRKSKFPTDRKVQFPDYPDFQFMFNFRKDFLEIYNDREFRERISGNRKAGLIVTLRKLGYTEEAAIAEVEDRTKHDNRIDELERWEQDLKDRERQFAARRGYGERAAPEKTVTKADVMRQIAERREKRRVRSDDELPPVEGMADRFRQIKGYEE